MASDPRQEKILCIDLERACNDPSVPEEEIFSNTPFDAKKKNKNSAKKEDAIQSIEKRKETEEKSRIRAIQEAQEAQIRSELEQLTKIRALSSETAKELPDKKNQASEQQPQDDGMTRRGFLLTGLSIAAAWAFSKFRKESKGDAVHIEIEGHNDQETEIIEPDIEVVQERYSEMFKTLGLDKDGEIQLDLDKMVEVKDLIKKQMITRENLYSGYEQATYRMGGWEDRIKAEFRKAGVPEKYVNLAIIESHMICRAKSKTGAVGPYQFMPDTAKEHGLRFQEPDGKGNFVFDERRSPIASGKQCAVYLKRRQRIFKDWMLTLSSYNGGYASRYRKKALKNNEEVNYAGFVPYMADLINDKKVSIERAGVYEYKVEAGDTLSKISKKFVVTEKELCELNHIYITSTIIEGSRLTIPFKEDNKQEVLADALSGELENLLYAQKFQAYQELSEEGVFAKKREAYDLDEERIKRNERKFIGYQVEPGDTLYGITHRKFREYFPDQKNAVAMLQAQNKHIGSTIGPKDKIKIPTNQLEDVTIGKVVRNRIRQKHE